MGDKVPVLMISASRHLGLVHNCLKAGADMCAAGPRSHPNSAHYAPDSVTVVPPHSHPHRDPNLTLTLALALALALILILAPTLTPTPIPTAPAEP